MRKPIPKPPCNSLFRSKWILTTIKAIQDGKAISPVRGLIRSPIAGTVVDRPITPGELLQAGTTPCFTVADLSRVWVMAHLFGSDLGSVSVGDPAEVLTGTASENFAGTVDNISAVVDPDTRSVAVRVVADNPGGALKKADVRPRADSFADRKPPACWCRFRRFCATKKICRSFMSCSPTAASRGSA